MEIQPENHKDKVPIEDVLAFLLEVKALAQQEKGKTKPENKGQRVSREEQIELLLEVKALAQEEKKAREMKASATLKPKKQQNAERCLASMTYSSSFRA